MIRAPHSRIFENGPRNSDELFPEGFFPTKILSVTNIFSRNREKKYISLFNPDVGEVERSTYLQAEKNNVIIIYLLFVNTVAAINSALNRVLI